MNISKIIKESNKQNNISKVIAPTKNETKSGTQPSGMFGQTITVECNTLQMSNENYDIEFTIPFDCDVEPNEAEIIVYNLTKTSISKLLYNKTITVMAGYRNDTGIIFSGRISKVTTKKDSTDKITTIYAIDEMNLADRDIQEKSYSENTKASVILKDLLTMTKLPIALFKIRKDYTYKESEKIDGSLIDLINDYAQVCGVNVYIRNGKIYAHDIRTASVNSDFTLKASTGLINDPEETEEEITTNEKKEIIKGYKLQTLLQHRLHSGVKVSVDCQSVKGVFSVKKGEHKYSGNNLTTEIEVIK